MSTKPPRRPLPAARAAHRGAARVLDILEFLADGRDGFTLTALSRRLRVPKSSLLALLRTFVERGYLDQEAAGAYHLGPRPAEIGLRPSVHRELPAVAGPVLQSSRTRAARARLSAC
jgi:DNA-binding IclR family transcriptional regulator